MFPLIGHVYKLRLVHILHVIIHLVWSISSVTMHIIHCNHTVDSNLVYHPPKAFYSLKGPQRLLQQYKLPQQGTRLFP
jgi:hypothetical protein